MKLSELHSSDKGVSAAVVFKDGERTLTSLQILAGQLLKEHITKIPACLVCVKGEVEYQDENGVTILLASGDYTKIEPNVKHWVKALENSQLVLFK